MDKDTLKLINRAFYDAQDRRPYLLDDEIIKMITPGGGAWQCVAEDGAPTRTIMWAGREVALVNPAGDIDDMTEGQIAMAIRALPVMDAALRSIMVLAEDPANAPAIAELAKAVMAHVEMPAPPIVERDEDDDGEFDE